MITKILLSIYFIVAIMTLVGNMVADQNQTVSDDLELDVLGLEKGSMYESRHQLPVWAITLICLAWPLCWLVVLIFAIIGMRHK